MLHDLQNYNPYQDRFLVDLARCDAKALKSLSIIINLEKINGTDFRNYDYNKLNSLLRFIYGDNVRPEISQIISLVHRKIIKDYLNIPHLSKLFNEVYFEYEWEMHSSLDKKNNRNSFYRDHYFHQARNLYEVMRWFEIGSLNQTILRFVKKSDGNIARYCAEVVERSKIECLGNQEMKSVFDDLRNAAKKELLDASQGGSKGISLDQYYEMYAYDYIIKGALFVASLTHDIGYPVDKQLQKSLIFRRFMSDFISDDKAFDFESVRGIIENSLLFEIVGIDAIKKALYKSNGQYDHGVLSALVLLVFYYKHGLIIGLPPLQRAIIEIAAIISFDHTASFGYGNVQEERENYPSYAKTPLSVLFRIFDDIQEWDRVYFDICKYSSLKICSRCKSPIVRYDLKCDIGNGGLSFVLRTTPNYIVNDLIKYGYKCACNDKFIGPYELDYGNFKQQLAFDAKTLNYIIASSRLYYFFENQSNNRIAESSKLDIFIDYNPYKLLDLLRFANCGFHSRRYNEIQALQRFVKEARIEKIDINVLAYIEIEPDLLKRKIIYDFLMALHFVHWAKKERLFQESSYRKIENEIYSKFQFDFNDIPISDDADDRIIKILSAKKWKELKDYSLFYHLGNCNNWRISPQNELGMFSSNEIIDDIFSADLIDIMKKIMGVSRTSEVCPILFPYLNISPIKIRKVNNLFQLNPQKVYSIMSNAETDEHFSSSKIDQAFLNKLSKYVDVDLYNGKPRYRGNVKIKVRGDSFIFNYTQTGSRNPANKFYSDLYYFSRINDFTEMVKEWISQELNID